MKAPDGLQRDLLAIRRHFWLVVLAFAVAFGAAIASLLLSDDTREASLRTSVTIQNAPPLWGAEKLPSTDDFAAVATSPDTLSRTSDALAAEGIGVSASDLAAKVTAKARRGQDSIDLTVKDESGKTALAIARAWGNTFVELAPEAAPSLQLLAAAPSQDQLAQAESALADARRAVSDLGGPGLVDQPAGGQFSALSTEYQTKITAIAAKEVERTNLQSTLDSLSDAIQQGTALSTGQLRVLLAGVLPADAPLGGALSAEEAAAALGLRLRSVDASIAALKQEAQFLQNSLQQRSGALQLALKDMQAAEDNYLAASRTVQSYQVAASTIQTTASVVKAPHLDRGGALEWSARLGAAAALALVVGILGTQLLALASRRREGAAGRGRRRVEEHIREREPVLAASAAQPGGGNVALSRKRKGLRHPTEALMATIAVAAMAGFLGTFAVQRRGRRRQR